MHRLGAGAAAAVVAVAICGDADTARDLPDYSHIERLEEEEAAARARKSYELRRAAAHARMPDTMYASTPSVPMAPHAGRDSAEAYHAPESPPSRWQIFFDASGFGIVSNTEDDDETAEDVFEEHISPVVQTKCVNCHVEGRTTGDMPVFVHDTNDDHLAKNLEEFKDYLATNEDGANTILTRIRGVGHGGGTQVPLGSQSYLHFERFLPLLGGAVDIADHDLTPETLFDGVGMAGWRTVMRRAALIFAGRAPTEAEYASMGEIGVKPAIRKLMQGPGFHEFLVRAANDRLLTDREGSSVTDDDHGPFVTYVNKTNAYCEAAAAGVDATEWQDWDEAVQHGAVRAPLELIAHVVENDLPYTEIMTADYVMANPQAAEAYGADTEFSDPSDVHEFRPSEFADYYLVDDSRLFRESGSDCQDYIVYPGDLPVDYPHAGILNSSVFMQRYPTTATNRNRARSRWTYYHFLGVDIEKSANRTTDAEALKDLNNPTFNNPNCTNCHSKLDPVAGTFQNYDLEGRYRSAHGGADSLDDSYKENPPGGADVLVEARSWDEREVVATDGYLVAGENTIGLKAVSGKMGLDLLTVRDSDGREVTRKELVRLPNSQCSERDGAFYRLDDDCIMGVPVSVASAGTYTVEVEAWAWDNPWEDRGHPVRLRLWAPGYIHQEGDTWYRDMRPPGFDGADAPDNGNSVQWLAQRIADDDRFAEATVKFWWPAIHGSEVLAKPDDAGDVDFEGLELAADAQDAEVKRLARLFRRSIQGRAPYNLKDLLVEMVVSKWFRADSMSVDHPVRRVALQHAGAKRLLTPEELAHKTASLTGVQWGREWRQPWHDLRARHTKLTHTYGTLYGGIDSDGITQRAGDMTAVMAGVAKSHAVEVSCPVVLREFYLLPDERRLLFEGIDINMTPMREFDEQFSIDASSDADPQWLRVRRSLEAGGKTLRLTFENDYYSEEQRADRNVRLDKVIVRNVADDTIVERYEFEDHPDRDCGDPDGDHYLLWAGDCALEVPLDLPADGTHVVGVLAWADQAGDEPARLRVELNSTDGNSIGARAIRQKLVELHDRLLGVRVDADSPDISAAYDLFVDVWSRKRETDDNLFSQECNWNDDQFFLDGILDGFRVRHRDRWNRGWAYEWNEDRIAEFWREHDFSDPEAMARTWTVVLMGLMMDQRYLHL